MQRDLASMLAATAVAVLAVFAATACAQSLTEDLTFLTTLDLPAGFPDLLGYINVTSGGYLPGDLNGDNATSAGFNFTAVTCGNPKGYNNLGVCLSGPYKNYTLYCNPATDEGNSTTIGIIDIGGGDIHQACTNDTTCPAGYYCNTYSGPGSCFAIAPLECFTPAALTPVQPLLATRGIKTIPVSKNQFNTTAFLCDWNGTPSDRVGVCAGGPYNGSLLFCDGTSAVANTSGLGIISIGHGGGPVCTTDLDCPAGYICDQSNITSAGQINNATRAHCFIAAPESCFTQYYSPLSAFYNNITLPPTVIGETVIYTGGYAKGDANGDQLNSTGYPFTAFVCDNVNSKVDKVGTCAGGIFKNYTLYCDAGYVEGNSSVLGIVNIGGGDLHPACNVDQLCPAGYYCDTYAGAGSCYAIANSDCFNSSAPAPNSLVPTVAKGTYPVVGSKAQFNTSGYTCNTSLTAIQYPTCANGPYTGAPIYCDAANTVSSSFADLGFLGIGHGGGLSCKSDLDCPANYYCDDTTFSEAGQTNSPSSQHCFILAPEECFTQFVGGVTKPNSLVVTALAKPTSAVTLATTGNSTAAFSCPNPGNAGYSLGAKCAGGTGLSNSLYCDPAVSQANGTGIVNIGKDSNVPCTGDASCPSGTFCNAYEGAGKYSCYYTADASCFSTTATAAITAPVATTAATPATPAAAAAPTSALALPTTTVSVNTSGSPTTAYTCSNPGTAGFKAGTCAAGTYANLSIYCDPASTLPSTTGILNIGQNTNKACTSDSQCAQGTYCDNYSGAGSCFPVAPAACFAGTAASGR